LFNGADILTTVAIHRIAVIACFTRFLLTIAADNKMRAHSRRTTAFEITFDPAQRITAVAAYGVAVIARFAAFSLSVSANGVARAGAGSSGTSEA
jgi:hypothetical protein